jgi:hypothetical protein
MLIGFFGWRIVSGIFHAMPSMAPVVTSPAPVRPAPVMPAFPNPQNQLNFVNPSDLTSLNDFIKTRQRWATRPNGQPDFAMRVFGCHVKWVGYLQGTHGPSSLKLAAENSPLAPCVRLTPVAIDVSENIRLMPIGTQVEIEGMLMDDQSLHLLSIREID